MLQDYRTFTSDELSRWIHLRSLEWFAMPAFLSQAIVPILLAIYQNLSVFIIFFIVDFLWRYICHMFVHIGLSEIGVLLGRLAWPSAIGSAIYLFSQHRLAFGVVTLFWPALATLLSVVTSSLARTLASPAKLQWVQIRFARRLGLPTDYFQ